MKKRLFLIVILMLICSASALASTSLEARIVGRPFSPKLFHVYADPREANTQKVGIVCGYDDDIVIERLLPEGWAQVRLPEEAGVGYCDTADALVNPDFSAKPLTVREATTVYSRYDCQVDLGAMEPGDACMLTGVHQGHSQVLWQTSDHAFRIGWLDGVYAAENGQLILTEASAPSTWPGWKLVERLLVLLLCHFVGDFVLQNAYLSDEKKRSWYHLLIHCFLYIYCPSGLHSGRPFRQRCCQGPEGTDQPRPGPGPPHRPPAVVPPLSPASPGEPKRQPPA